ncbi:MAG TPA: HAMP domain-containing sensor histidine kinase [Chthoniobacterales bacterium]|jgi:hypothetical protein|nr:HAMP domain-containing sensor histidine kinase [Chthoniobacterales bacterium]
MPGSDSPAQSVLGALGFVLFARDEAGGLQLLGAAPAWLTTLWPALQNGAPTLLISEASPFLENFLIDAEECWKKGGKEHVRSGPWIEQDANGEQVELDATALTAGGQSILLLERLGEAFAAKKAVLQHARETVIANQRLNSEIQKKQILLHSVANEMTAAVANVITSLQLIEREKNGERTKLLLALATRATEEQQSLIHRILGAFESDLPGLNRPSVDAQGGADWYAALQRALDPVAPLFAERNVRLDSAEAAAARARLSVDSGQLERVLVNLLSNSLERSAPGAAVIVRAEDEPDALLVSFEDSGPFLPARVCENLFAQRSSPGTASAAALRLEFCRLVVEDSGGEIGCVPLAAGGNRFWIRLVKSEASA